ncbi:L-fuconolactonase [Microbacterium sp. AG1240]|nr:L-fuconolactonase [Microbacterium sp. AG1240]
MLRYPWLDGAPHLNRPHLPDDIDDGGGRVDEWVFVEADPQGRLAQTEAEWVDALDWPGLVGIVAHLDLTRRDVARQLDDLSRIPRLRGVRFVLEGDTHVTDEGGLSGAFAILEQRSLTFDACVHWTQLSALARALDGLPAVNVILDHAGKPPVDDGLASGSGRAWFAALAELAAIPTVAVKLSGMPAEGSSTESVSRHAPDFLRASLDLFGAERSMFGSDWPVSARGPGGSSTSRWADTVASAAEAHDARWIFGATAEKIYALR